MGSTMVDKMKLEAEETIPQAWTINETTSEWSGKVAT
jgi:hypothetical protein